MLSLGLRSEKVICLWKNMYSQTQKSIDPMNVWSHCGSGQGWYFIYRDIKKIITDIKTIEIFDKSEIRNNIKKMIL